MSGLGGGEATPAKAPVGSQCTRSRACTRTRSTASRPPPRCRSPPRSPRARQPPRRSPRHPQPLRARRTAIGTPLPAARAAPVDRALGGRRRRPARGLGGARAGRHRPLADRASLRRIDSASMPCGLRSRPRRLPPGPASASEPASSTETAPIAFPAHGTAARQWRDPGALSDGAAC